MPSKELSFGSNVSYSAIGGVCGAAAVYPLDFIKTQLQSGAHGAASPVEVARKTLRASGIGGFYRGLPANVREFGL